MFQYSLAERAVPVPVSVPGKRFRFPVPVRFLGHPVKVATLKVFFSFGGYLLTFIRTLGYRGVQK